MIATKPFPEDSVKYDAQGLVPCVVESVHGGVRMVGYMNHEALTETLRSGFVTFFSRSKRRLWKKGESSGHTLRLQSLHLDCDGDAILARALCTGPTCHRATLSCFSDEATEAGAAELGLAFLAELETLLEKRAQSASLGGSYTEKLLAQGIDRIAKKVVEEAGEVVIAGKNLAVRADPANPLSAHAERAEFVGEAADLLFHLQLLLVSQKVSLAEVAGKLRERHDGRVTATLPEGAR